MSTAFFAIGLVIALAALLGAWSSFFKLPLILAYIVTGIVVGPFLFKTGTNSDIFLLLRDLGLSFLLFLVGLEINTSELKQFGRQAITTGIVQIVGTGAFAFGLSMLVGFSFIASFYVSVALTFSSTVIVIKLLNEKRDYDSLYGKLTVAILLLQDLVAILFLIVFSGVKTSTGFSFLNLILTIFSGAFLFGLIYFLNQKVLPYLFERLARNLELLFLSSLAWLFIVVALSSSFNFSLEIGAFIAGLSLASLKQEHQIASRVKPLRDFFLVIFFIVLGSHIVVGFNFMILYQAVIFSAFVLLVKPLIVLVTLGQLGFKRRTGFMTGVSLAQVSEFSLIIMFLGLKNGQVSEHLVAVITLTALITIAVSSYTLVFATKIYRSLERYLKPFEKKGEKIEVNTEKELDNHVVLIGCDRLGGEVLKQLQKQGREILVVDFNPTIIKFLKEAEINHLFGDITDPDIWDQARIAKASLVISTVFDPGDTEELLSKIKTLAEKPLVFVTAADRNSAITFYKRGADYVIVPRILSGHQVAHLLSSQKLSEIREGEIKNDHLEELRGRVFD